MGRTRLNKPKPREINHDFLQDKYAETETTPQQKVMKTIILNLYQSGFIRTKKGAENLINKYLVSAKNKQRQNKQFRNQMIKYISKSPIKLNSIIDKGDKAAEEVETNNLIKSVSIIDSNKPFTKIKIELNSKPAFPDMPDLVDSEYETIVLEHEFENGVPHKDTNFKSLMGRLKPQFLKIVQDILEKKESIKIQFEGYFQFYKFGFDENNRRLYVQSNTHRKTIVMDITRIDVNDVLNNLLNLLGEELVSEKMKGSGWKVRQIPTITINVYEKRPARGASSIPTPSIYNYPNN